MKRIWKTARALFSGQKPPPLSRVEAAFDKEFYLAANEDVCQAGVDPWLHFLTHGWQEGRKPHPQFDVSWYLNGNPDVAIGGNNPFEHFVLHGWREGRQPIEGFVCDRMAFLKEDNDSGRFNPLDHLVSVNGDFHDWSAKLREVAASDPEEAIRLGSVWKRKAGRDKALPRIRLGELLASQGEYSEAAAEFEEALVMEPGGNEPLILLAECAIRSGDWPKFEEVMERLVKNDPEIFKNPDGTTQAARLEAFQWLRGGRLLEAWASFDSLAKTNPEDALVFLGRGLVLLELKSDEESFDDLWRALRINSKLKQARNLLKGSWSEFIKDQASSSGEDLPGLSGDWEDALPGEILEKIDRLDSQDAASPPFLRLKVYALLARGEIEGAVESLTELANSGFCSRETRCLEGRVLVRANDLSQAMATFQALLEVDPADPYLRFRTLELSDRTRTRAPLSTCLRKEGSLEMARALFLAHCFDAAAMCLEESGAAEESVADQAERLSRLARCRLKTGQFLRARETALKALEISPASGDAHAVAGAVSRRFGDHSEAIRHFQSAIESGPQEPWIYRDLAAELDRSGKRKAAIEMLEQGLQEHEADPETERDHKRLIRLRKLHGLSESISKAQSAGQPVSSEREEEFVWLLRKFIDADWPVIGRDFAECRVCMDVVIRKGENWPLHLAYGDLLVRCGNKFDALGYYEEAHRTSATLGAHEEVRSILRKIIAILEQLELYERCLSYLEQVVHGLPVSECLPEYRRLACYSAMLGKRDQALGYWQAFRSGSIPRTT